MKPGTTDFCHSGCEQFRHSLTNSVGSNEPADCLRSDEKECALHGY